MTAQSHERQLSNCLNHDYMPADQAKSFSLREFYVGLRWARMVSRAMHNIKKEMTSIYDVLDVAVSDPDGGPRAVNVLVEGR